MREDLGASLTAPASGSADEIVFTVQDGDTPATIAPRLAEAGIIEDERAFLFQARVDDLAAKLTAGSFGLAGNLTPGAGRQRAGGANRLVIRSENITFREGLRIEQMTAKLQNTPGTHVDAKAFYDLAMKPTDELLADYPWLLDEAVRPKGSSLEGFLYPATYSVRTDGEKATTAEDLVRMMLDAFYERVGPERMAVAKERGLTFQQILVLASIVEREAVVDEERPLIAGVYQNRLNPKKFPTGLLQSDPTIFYVNDTLKLREMPLEDWVKYVFWDDLKGEKLPEKLPDDLAPYNTYTSKGLPPGPDLPRPRSRRSMRRSARTRRPATCSSSRRATAPAPARSRRRRPRTTRTSRSTARRTDVALPVPADFAPPPDATTRARWRDAERSQLPGRLERLRARMAAEGVEAYFGVKREHMRWLTGFTLADGEEKVAGHSGQLLVGPEDVVLVTDSRYTIQARREAPGRGGRRDRLRPRGLLAAARGAGRCPARGRRGRRPSRTRCGRRLAAAAPGRGARGGRRLDRGDAGRQEPRRDRADRGGLRGRRPGARGPAAGDPGRRDRARPGAAPRVADADRRRGGAGVRRRLPGRPGGGAAARVARATGPSVSGEVLLFDFGAQVEGYRSDMTRTLFVGEPAARDLAVYDLVRRAQQAAVIDDARGAGRGGRRAGRPRAGRHRAWRDRRRRRAGRRTATAWATGSASRRTRNRSLSRAALRGRRCPAPPCSAWSPGIYLEGETGVRIEDLVHLDASRGLVERLTLFPGDVIILEG